MQNPSLIISFQKLLTLSVRYRWRTKVSSVNIAMLGVFCVEPTVSSLAAPHDHMDVERHLRVHAHAFSPMPPFPESLLYAPFDAYYSDCKSTDDLGRTKHARQSLGANFHDLISTGGDTHTDNIWITIYS